MTIRGQRQVETGEMNGLQAVSTTGEPAFATDSEGRIIAWNAAAETLFGHRGASVRGRYCWEVVAGRDIFGNRYCGPACPLVRMARKVEAIQRCIMVFRDVDGGKIRARLSTLALPARRSDPFTVVHLLRPLSNVPLSDLAASRPSDHRGRFRLSPREGEVLALLAEGKATSEMAGALGISTTTIRNHVDHLLHKLEVHSRVEAVALAYRLGLLD